MKTKINGFYPAMKNDSMSREQNISRLREKRAYTFK